MLLGPALSRDGFAGAAQNTRHRGGAVWSPLSKKNREVDRPGQSQRSLTIYPTGNLDDTSENSSGKHEGRSTRRNSPISTALHVSMHGTHGGAQRGRVGITIIIVPGSIYARICM